MSRSFHETWRQFGREQRFEFADEAQRRTRRAEQLLALRRKHATKRLVAGESGWSRDPIPPTNSDLIPIRVLDEGPYVNYPASQDDLRRVMRLLPKGSLDGVQLIELGLGYAYQEQLAGSQSKRDPFTARAGIEVAVQRRRWRSLGRGQIACS